MVDHNLEKKFNYLEGVNDLREMLRISAAKYADKVAFTTKIKEKGSKEVKYKDTTYKEFFQEMVYLGTGLIRLGYQGKRIALIGDNSYKWVLSYLASACGVGVIVPLDKGMQKEEIESCLERSNAEVVICDRKLKDKITSIKEDGKTKVSLIVGLDYEDEKSIHVDKVIEKGEKLVKEGDSVYLDTKIDTEALSFLMFTSGTTSQSKAVMLSHKNFTSCVRGMDYFEYFTEDDVSILILPLHHCYGFGGLLVFLTQGMKNVFCDGLKYVSANLKEYGVSVFMSVPLLLENIYKKINKAIEAQGLQKKISVAIKLCNASDKIGLNLRKKLFKPIIDQMGGRIRFIINGAAPLDPVVSKGLNDFGILTVQGYGLTETSPTISSENYQYVRPGSVGKLMPNVEGKISQPNEEGIGEIIVRGDNVMLGYYNDQEATDEVIKDGWLHTGDLGYFDKDGYLFICGREKNVIVMKNGKNVFPEEIENNINTLEYVEESMVFPYKKHNELVIGAKIVYSKEYLKDKKLTIEELQLRLDEDMRKINDSMPSFKIVKKYFLSDIPTIKTTTQKTKRRLEMVQIKKEMQE